MIYPVIRNLEFMTQIKACVIYSIGWKLKMSAECKVNLNY